MKLIDILVQELPKRGGWPAEASFAMQDSDGLVKFSRSGEKIYHDHNDGHEWCSEGGYDWIRNGVPFEGNFRTQVSHDNVTAFISREKYEAALAASKPEWDGKFPIPAGTDVEVHFDGDDCRVWTRFRVEFMAGDVVVLHDYRVDDVDAYKQRNLSFRPIRSEGDKKRDEAIESIKAMLMYDYGDDPRLNDAVILYDAIAAGKIPHIRID